MARRRSPSVPAFNPFGLWVELATQSTEMLVASSQVVAQRSARIATSGVNPSLADREEFALMSSEKLEAFSSSAATLASAWTPALQSISEQALHASTAIVSGAWKLAASRTPAELFGRHVRAQARGADVNYTFAIDFLEAINGAKKRVVMADGRTLDITIPAGLQDGRTLRLKGQGQPGRASGANPGDVLVAIHVKPHAIFSRDGDTIRSTLPVTPGEALAGAKLTIATASGTVTLAVPKGSNTGTMLRLRGKGVPSKNGNGDHVVELRIILPASPDDEFIQSIVAWEAKHPYDPRKGLGAQS